MISSTIPAKTNPRGNKVSEEYHDVMGCESVTHHVRLDVNRGQLVDCTACQAEAERAMDLLDLPWPS